MSTARYDRSRREFLRALARAGTAVAAGFPLSLYAASQRAVETPNMVVGPFYPLLKPLDQDSDLTRVSGRKGQASGTVIEIAGRILDRSGRPVRSGRIEIWQANAFGRYAHPSDPNTTAAPDPNFQGFAVLRTDSEGRYRFRTVKPAPYPSPRGDAMRAPHIHVDVQGRIDRKVTQMFFPGEALNGQDPLLRVVRGDREALVATARTVGDDPPLYTWDIVLASG